MIRINQILVERDNYIDTQGEMCKEDYLDFMNRVSDEINFIGSDVFIDVKYPDKDTAIIVAKEEIIK